MPNKTEIFDRMLALGKLMRAHLAEEGLSPLWQFETLRFIDEKRSPTMRELAHYLAVTAPTATAQANELVRMGLVRRKPDAHDRRTVRLEITSTGSRALRSDRAKRKKVLAGLFERVSQADRKIFNTILGKLIEQ